MNRWSYKKSLQLLAGLLFLVVVVESALIARSVMNISEVSRQVVNTELGILNKAHELKLAVVQVQQWLTDISATRGLDGLNDGFDEAAANAALFRETLAGLQLLDPQHAADYEAMLPVFDAYYKAGQKMAQAYIDYGPAGGNPIMAEFDAAAAAMAEQVDSFLAAAIERANGSGHTQLAAVTTLNITTAASTVVLVISILMAFLVVRSLMRFLGGDPETLKVMADRITAGDLTEDNLERNPVGVYKSLIDMRSTLRKQLDDIQQRSVENGRITTALDNVSSPVMVLDTAQQVIYANHAATRLFQRYESPLRQIAPAFASGACLKSRGTDVLAGNSALLAAVQTNQSTTADLILGSAVWHTVVNPVRDSSGQLLGTAIEFNDRTDEVAIEQEIARVVQSACLGDLTRRIGLAGKSGFFNELGSGINTLMIEVEKVFSAFGQVLAKMSHGDFSSTIQGDYQGSFGDMQRDVNETLTRLSEVVANLRDSVTSLEASSQEIAGSNEELSHSAARQASDLEQIAAAMEEITANVRLNADKAEAVSQLTRDTDSIAGNSKQVVLDAVQSMAQISDSSKRIHEIIGVIDEIAFQTNLLALNASVEAARAGEQGKGFAVVASEVRNLAGRSATAAQEIKSLIEDSVQKVESGTHLVNRSGETLESIVMKIDEIKNLVGEIALSNREQSAGVGSLSSSILNIDKLTQNNAVLARQVLGVTENMRSRAVESNDMMAFFKAS